MKFFKAICAIAILLLGSSSFAEENLFETLQAIFENDAHAIDARSFHAEATWLRCVNQLEPNTLKRAYLGDVTVEPDDILGDIISIEVRQGLDIKKILWNQTDGDLASGDHSLTIRFRTNSEGKSRLILRNIDSDEDETTYCWQN